MHGSIVSLYGFRNTSIGTLTSHVVKTFADLPDIRMEGVHVWTVELAAARKRAWIASPSDAF